MRDGETFQTEGAAGVAKWKEGTWHIQKLSPDGDRGVSLEQAKAEEVYRSQTV